MESANKRPRIEVREVFAIRPLTVFFLLASVGNFYLGVMSLRSSLYGLVAIALGIVALVQAYKSGWEIERIEVPATDALSDENIDQTESAVICNEEALVENAQQKPLDEIVPKTPCPESPATEKTRVTKKKKITKKKRIERERNALSPWNARFRHQKNTTKTETNKQPDPSKKQAMCLSKKRYLNKRTAKTIVNERMQNGSEALLPYECPFCGGWHITKRNASRSEK